MAVQQNKKSKSKKGMRRSHHSVPVPSVVLCECGKPSLPHSVCPSCGNYRGKSYAPAAE
jgi:ribosomal protein L32